MPRAPALLVCLFLAHCGASSDGSTPTSSAGASGSSGSGGRGGGGGSSLPTTGGAAGAAQGEVPPGGNDAAGGGAPGPTDASEVDAGSVFDSSTDAPVLVSNKQVLMVGLSSGKPSPGDTLMINRLEGRGFKVTLVADTATTAASAAGKDLIVISSSEESGNLGVKLRDLAIPTVCMEDGSFADMKMASDRGHEEMQTAIKFVGSDPLTGGLSGSVPVGTDANAAEFGWGTVGPKAVVAATAVADPNHVALFGYRKGDEMLGMIAPASRVGFAMREGIAGHFSEQGLEVFDTAVDWSLGLK